MRIKRLKSIKSTFIHNSKSIFAIVEKDSMDNEKMMLFRM